MLAGDVEEPEFNEAIMFHDFPKSRGALDKVVVGPLLVTLIPRLNHALLHLKPKADEFLQLNDRHEILEVGLDC